MKKNYITPSLEISVFEAEDIITSSGIEFDTGSIMNHEVYSPIQWEDNIIDG